MDAPATPDARDVARRSRPGRFAPGAAVVAAHAARPLAHGRLCTPCGASYSVYRADRYGLCGVRRAHGPTHLAPQPHTHTRHDTAQEETQSVRQVSVQETRLLSLNNELSAPVIPRVCKSSDRL